MKTFVKEYTDCYNYNQALDLFINDVEDAKIVNFDPSMLKQFIIPDDQILALCIEQGMTLEGYKEKFLKTEPDALFACRSITLEKGIEAKDGFMVKMTQGKGARKFQSMYEVRVDLEGVSKNTLIPGYDVYQEKLALRAKTLEQDVEKLPWISTTKDDNHSPALAEFVKQDDAKKFAKDYALVTGCKTVIVAVKNHMEGPKLAGEVLKADSAPGKYLFMLKHIDEL